MVTDIDGFEYRPAASPGAPACVPVVVLLGWTMSSPAALRKYAAAWNAIGCQTYAACPGVAQLWRPSTVRGQIVALSEGLTNQTTIDRQIPIVVHMFSAAVSMYLWHIAECCAMGKLRVVGLVFDSCPVDYTRESGLNAVREMGLAWPLRSLVAGAGVVVEWWSGAEKRDQLTKSVSHPTMQVPALYIYSEEGDQVAPHTSVERWATEHAARGNMVVRKFWAESQHVSHLRLHEADYKEAIAAFFNDHVIDVEVVPTQSARL